jgi:hypothetical protein
MVLWVMKDDSTEYQVKGAIDFSDSVHRIEYKEDRAMKVILPSETLLVSHVVIRQGEGTVASRSQLLKGIPTDSCWLFLVVEGAINCYGYLPVLGMDYVIVIQKGSDGNRVPLTKANLQAIVGSDPRWKTKIEKGKLTQVIRAYNKEMEESK